MAARILVSGSSGYVGSHTVKFLSRAGWEVFGLDVLPPPEQLKRYLTAFLVADMGDTPKTVDLCRRNKVNAVIHCAAKCVVSESVEKPDLYMDHNVRRATRFADAVEMAGVRAFLFSSTAAVYGEPERVPIPEDHPVKPINPYGRSKVLFEEELLARRDAGRLALGIYRYFNVAGADPEGELGEVHDPETHIIPNAILAALGRTEFFPIFGTNYPTRDGTCERDYIHVQDLAGAHLLMAERLLKSDEGGIFNLGAGRGFTVREVLDEVDRQTGRKLAREERPRRPGDPAVLVADASRAHAQLTWTPTHSTLEEMISSGLAWHRQTLLA